ncbi:ferritin-like domain-containing protein [Nocardioides sp. URHA0020]|uniref:ferritin-like domain-containing protein n=1 Tax=Nocardioides sp. URHA0020 TaxID=1380392 RepID=UPI0004907E7E|nr:ferritin-like domain-containing protein [Nocardioides sp. URHA0020]
MSVAALQTALAGEHAAVFVLGALAGRASLSGDPELLATVSEGYVDHRLRRDQLTAAIRDLGAEPVAADASYVVPAGLDRPGRIARVARATEQACAETYSWLVANTVDDLRQWAIRALNETAVRVLTLRGTPEIFPGAGEYADR